MWNKVQQYLGMRTVVTEVSIHSINTPKNSNHENETEIKTFHSYRYQ